MWPEVSTKDVCIFKDKAKYVGFLVLEKGISTGPDKVEKVANWPTPIRPVYLKAFYKELQHDSKK